MSQPVLWGSRLREARRVRCWAVRAGAAAAAAAAHRDHLDLALHGLRDDQDVTVHDGRVDPETRDGLDGEVGCHVLVADRVEEVDGVAVRPLATLVVLRQVAARLAHQPHRRAVRGLALGGTEQDVVVGVHRDGAHLGRAAPNTGLRCQACTARGIQARDARRHAEGAGAAHARSADCKDRQPPSHTCALTYVLVTITSSAPSRS